MLESIMESISKLASDISGTSTSIVSTLNAFPEGQSMGIMRNAVSSLTGKDIPLSAVAAMNTAQQGPKSAEPELGGTTQVARATSNDRGMSV